MGKAQRSFQTGLQYYVPAMQAGAELGQQLDMRVEFGTPKLASATGNDILNATIIANAGVSTTMLISTANVADAPFGRNVGVKASGATGANLVTKVFGRDYLGQAMNETITVANGDGTTQIVGLKAFKYIDKIVHNGGASNAVTASLGFGGKLGLPYNTRAVEREYADFVVAAAGTLVAGVLTDPQTTTTGDVRGTYIPTTTLDGVKKIAIDAQFSSYVNAANNGGLHGIPQFNG